jgi:hypothetical protein
MCVCSQSVKNYLSKITYKNDKHVEDKGEN